MSINIRLMTAGDLNAVVQIQDSCYSEALYEAPALLSQRLTAQPNSCWVAQHVNGTVLAYLLSYPAKNGNVAPLGSAFKHYNNADVLYLHDMAVSAAARGQGLAQQLLCQAWRYANAEGLTRLALVAVQGSVPFWQRHGFSVVTLTDEVSQRALQSYTGQEAKYMQKAV